MRRSIFVAALMAVPCPTFATECPQGVPSCKVLILTPQEEAMLMQPNGVLNTAEQARFLDLGPVASYFRDKIKAAPAGEVKPPPEPSGGSAGK